MNNQITILQNKLNTRSQEVETSHRVQGELKVKLDESYNLNETLATQLKNDTKNFQSQNENLKGAIKEQSEEIGKLNNKIINLEKELEKKSQEIATLNEKNTGLERELKDSEKTLEDARKDFENSKKELNDKLGDSEKKYNELKKEYDELVENSTLLFKEKEELEKQVETIKQEFADFKEKTPNYQRSTISSEAKINPKVNLSKNPQQGSQSSLENV